MFLWAELLHFTVYRLCQSEVVEPVSLGERKKKNTIKPSQAPSVSTYQKKWCQPVSKLPLCLRALWKTQQHKKHPEPINTMTTTHESGGYDRSIPEWGKERRERRDEGVSTEDGREGVISVWVFFSTSSGLQVITRGIYLSPLPFHPPLSSISTTIDLLFSSEASRSGLLCAHEHQRTAYPSLSLWTLLFHNKISLS